MVTRAVDLEGVPENQARAIEEQARYWCNRIEDARRLKNMKKTGGIAHDEMMDWLDDLAAGRDV